MDTSFISSTVDALRELIGDLQRGQSVADCIASSDTIDDDTFFSAMEISANIAEAIDALQDGVDALEVDL